MVVGALVVLALVGGIAWFGPWRSDDDDHADSGSDPARLAAEAFAVAWEDGTLADVPAAPSKVAPSDLIALVTAGLHAVDGHPRVKISDVEKSADGTRAVATADITWRLDDTRDWTYSTAVTFVETPETDDDGDVAPQDRWLLSLTPAAIHPSLEEGDVLRATLLTAARGQILDKEGTNLTGGGGSVVVGIRPNRTEDPEATARTVATMVGVDADELSAKVDAAGPDEFVEVVTLDRPAYNAIRDEIQPLPGTVFREENDGPSLPANFANGLLGSTGPASAETAESSDGSVREGEITGVSGLQLSQNEVLAGQPGLTVEAVGADGPPRALKVYPAEAGRSITVTIDRKVQIAADQTLADTELPSALVAIRVSTGEVLAVSNGPAGSSAYNRAMIGRYAPGSVFKIASGLAILQQGITPDTFVDCPATATVGKVFRNAGGFELGNVPFRTDFARSCNTAFVGLADDVNAQQLADTAALLGYRRLELGAPLFQASVPTDGDATEHAAQMIGQGRVEATPVHVALATASVANGRSLEPTLVVDPDAPTPGPGTELPADLIIQLREMMRLVVTEGTGTSLADVAGGEVRAKTGTAEFGGETPPETHAWITGYQGDVAFAVLVEGGGGGGSVAGPIAADFVNALADA